MPERLWNIEQLQTQWTLLVQEFHRWDIMHVILATYLIYQLTEIIIKGGHHGDDIGRAEELSDTIRLHLDTFHQDEIQCSIEIAYLAELFMRI